MADIVFFSDPQHNASRILSYHEAKVTMHTAREWTYLLSVQYVRQKRYSWENVMRGIDSGQSPLHFIIAGIEQMPDFGSNTAAPLWVFHLPTSPKLSTCKHSGLIVLCKKIIFKWIRIPLKITEQLHFNHFVRNSLGPKRDINAWFRIHKTIIYYLEIEGFFGIKGSYSLIFALLL